ncbi:hypothetical protein HZC07_06135 [Candidatus Micrarchaeota archaeon]|nr:hypothetical protein [Candidatus Micrarchaeota archaeon]
MTNKFYLAGLFFVLLLSFSFAYTTGSSGASAPTEKFLGILQVNKSAPATANIGDTIEVSIVITNPTTQPASLYVKESLGNVDPVDPQPTYTNVPNGSYGAEPPALSWQLNVSAGAEKTITYKIKPKTVGSLAIGPTQVFVNGGGKFYSNSLEITVVCSSSASCNEAYGETPLTCPNKCGGSANVTPSEPPTLQVIPSAPVSGPDSNVLNQAPPKALQDEKNMLMYVTYALGAIIILFILYMVYKKMKK